MKNIAFICIRSLRSFSKDLINLLLAENIVNRDVSYKVNYNMKDDLSLFDNILP